MNHSFVIVRKEGGPPESLTCDSKVVPKRLQEPFTTKSKLKSIFCWTDYFTFFNRNQRNRLKLDNMSLPSPERHRPLRHLYSSDNMHVPPFNIPNLRIEQRKTSSAEDMARKNSTGKCSPGRVRLGCEEVVDIGSWIIVWGGLGRTKRHATLTLKSDSLTHPKWILLLNTNKRTLSR